MSAKIPAFTDIGKSAREVLFGGREGVFQYNQQVTISSKTANGIEFTASSLKRDDKLETAIKAGYKHNNINTIATFSHLGKVTGSATINDIAPGLSATLAGTLPDVQSLKLSIEYYLPHVTAKALVGLTASPTINASLSTGWNDLTLGTNFTVDTAKNNSLTNWTAGVGYTGLDYQVAALLADKGDTLKITGAHNIDASQGLAAEIARSLNKDEATIVTLGYQRRLQQGALAKVRLDNTGSLHVLYELEAQKNTKLSFSSQFDATNLEKTPKFGVALDIKN
jgi:voltage-dependent anion channel protein 2